jgi:hypothetical protein
MRQETSISDVKLSLLQLHLGVDSEQHLHFSLPHHPEYKHFFADPFYFNSSLHFEDYGRHQAANCM